MKKILLSTPLVATVCAQDLTIQEFQLLSRENAQLEVDGGDLFMVEASNDLRSPSWVILGDPAPVPLVNGSWQVALATGGSNRQFYRVSPVVPIELSGSVTEGGDLVVSFTDANGPRAYRGLLNYEINFLLCIESAE